MIVILVCRLTLFFFFTDPSPTEIYTLSLHDALPILLLCLVGGILGLALGRGSSLLVQKFLSWPIQPSLVAVVISDRKSTRLNSSHPSISYAVFCLKKKKKSL